MVRITVDTEKDSLEAIQKIIALLEHFMSQGTLRRSYQESSHANAPAGSSGYTDMFATMPTSEPIQPKNEYADMFAPKKEVLQNMQTTPASSAPSSVSSFFDMASPSSTTSSSSLSSPSSVSNESPSEGMFDMFSEKQVTTDTSLPSSSPVPDYPSVFDNYTEEKEDFSRKDYLKVQEYDE